MSREFSGYAEYQNQEYLAALPKLKLEAEAGNAEAQCMLAHLYQIGIAGEENADEAIVWYQRSSKQGYGVASNNLGQIHQCLGELGRAREYFQLARKQGFVHAPIAR